MSTLLSDIDKLLAYIEATAFGETERKIIQMRARIADAMKEKASGIEIGRYKYRVSDKMLIYPSGAEVRLTTKESGLLEYLYENRGKVNNSYDIIKEVWGVRSYHTKRSMDVYIARLRKLLNSDTSVTIRNVHGEGFELVIPNSEIK